ncbi:hypothetical protein JOD43_003008 [Pullulanibacillus pueri]|uniref:DUF4305 domain-containing protein n=1 Tax=Pullulanibacillus pueri TaxID=1437324 RepID=A0A8J2ZWK0_9BACL|nr:DUF4305 domain-containing protein [Pullulanibacillus pueri]MBM7682829.1 hypothetical protein [Pullulanibacillus pueri]GGH83358.1 hypothetical protein GCM10007096_24110 [Pullulanibacillus pueri]
MKLNMTSVVYLLLGITFIAAAVHTSAETLWNLPTLLFIGIAAFDIKVGLSALFQSKHQQK